MGWLGETLKLPPSKWRMSCHPCRMSEVSPCSKKLHNRPPYLTLMPWAETRVTKTTVSTKLVLREVFLLLKAT